jgi:hypothetical protein
MIKYVVTMEWLIKMIDWFQRETWWRRYYKRITLDEKTTWRGRCLVCDAGTPINKNIMCNMVRGRDCPCKYNQCLKFK